MRGVWTALVTPFDRQNHLDLDSFRRIIHDQKDAGISGVIPCGTTGETPCLSVDEKKVLIQTAVKELKGTGVKVFAGTGSNSTRDTIEFSQWAAEQGVDGLLVVTPYYNKPSQAGLIQHYQAIADAVPCELMLYNVPGRTGVSMTAATVAALAKHPKIRTLKEATANVAFTSEIVDTLAMQGTKIDIMSGDDATYLPLLSVGAVGVVSVASNLFPRGMVAIFKAIESGNIEEARRIHQRFYPLFRDLFVDSNPVPIKYAMSAMGWCENSVRAPLVALSAANTEILQASMKRCGLSKGTPA